MLNCVYCTAAIHTDAVFVAGEAMHAHCFVELQEEMLRGPDAAELADLEGEGCPLCVS